MITHNIRSALELGNRTIMMDDGRILLDFCGTEREKMTVSDLMERFSKACSKQIDNDRMLLGTPEQMRETSSAFCCFIQKFDFVLGNILKAVLP